MWGPASINQYFALSKCCLLSWICATSLSAGGTCWFFFFFFFEELAVLARSLIDGAHSVTGGTRNLLNVHHQQTCTQNLANFVVDLFSGVCSSPIWIESADNLSKFLSWLGPCLALFVQGSCTLENPTFYSCQRFYKLWLWVPAQLFGRQQQLAFKRS